MMRIALPLATALAATATPGVAAPQDAPYPIGEKVQIERDGFANPLVLRLPDNYSPDRLWPVVFHYPGTGGNPGVDIPLVFTGGRDFVLVGMEFATRNLTSLKEDYLPIEMAALRSVRDDLAAEISIDPKRSYVGGFSKGGWFASEFADVYMREFAGAYILGAGKSHRRVRNPVSFGPVKKPVYIGIGQIDPNYIYSVRAVEHFRNLGGTVTFDEYLGAGHRISTGYDAPSGFANWWAIEAAKTTGDHAALAQKREAWDTGLSDRLEKIESPLSRFLLLERARRNPLYGLLTAERRAELDGVTGALAAAPAVASESGLRSGYYLLLDDESQRESWDHYRSLAKRYHEFYLARPESYYGRRAALDCYRLGSLLGMEGRWRFPTVEEQTRALAEAASDPTPAVQVESVLPTFQDLGGALAPY